MLALCWCVFIGASNGNLGASEVGVEKCRKMLGFRSERKSVTTSRRSTVKNNSLKTCKNIMPEQTVVRTGETEVYSLAVSNSVFVYCVIFVGSDHTTNG